MNLTFRPIKAWPEGWDRDNPPTRSSPFSATYSQTREVLDRELSQLGATEATLQLDTAAGNIRADGQMSDDAKVTYPGVILTVATRQYGALTYSCNRFGGGQTWSGGSRKRRPGWHENLRAIALGLEALRKVERYGIANRGEQYRGYAELPVGIPMGRAMTVEEAIEFLRIESGWVGDFDPLADPLLDAAYRLAAKRLHPDAGGDPDAFRRLVEAKELLERTVMS